MKIVTYTDDEGYSHRAMLRDKDPDDLANRLGIPLDPPSLEDVPSIPNEEARRALHNALVARGLATYADVLAAQDGVTGAVKSISAEHKIDKVTGALIRRHVVYLYKIGG
jgi:hypothetical protein